MASSIFSIRFSSLFPAASDDMAPTVRFRPSRNEIGSYGVVVLETRSDEPCPSESTVRSGRENDSPDDAASSTANETASASVRFGTASWEPTWSAVKAGEMLTIDYDFAANPGFLIRRILDELVQVDDALYLGKVLLRWRGSFRRLGFFSLECP